ncbi:DegV family protein [Fructilactobacillus vespulae]|uniref:DegV family protein n=1 Tax=Fructilactobacillus vespulae TaxID=1249630 RepID=UPI0039B3B55A
MRTAIVTDSSAYLSEEDIQKYNIHVIPLTIVFGDQSYQEGIDITNAEFYDKLANSKELPTTSQPPIGMLIEEYNKLAAEGYDNVISIHLAATISGLYNQVVNVSQMIDSINVIPFDSQITVGLMGDLAKYASELAKAETDPQEIISKLKEQRQTIDELFVVDDLQNLVKGGRLSNASAFIGGLLNIKPILKFDDETDKIVAFDKVRTMKRALKRVESLFEEKLAKVDYPVKLFVLNGNNPKSGSAWAEKIAEQFPDLKIEQGTIGPAIGTHLGQGALILGWQKEFDFDKK